MWTAQTLIPVSPAPKPIELAQANFRAYTLGWSIADYRGQVVVSHGGGVPGSVTLIVIAPKRDVAFAIMTNSEESVRAGGHAVPPARSLLRSREPGLDQGREARCRRRGSTKAREQSAAARRRGEAAEADEGTVSADREVRGNAIVTPGTARSTIEKAANGLNIRFHNTPKLSGPLEHVRYDTFRTRWADRTIEDTYVTFALKPDGSIDRMTMRAVSPLADFSFDYHDLMFVPEG